MLDQSCCHVLRDQPPVPVQRTVQILRDTLGTTGKDLLILVSLKDSCERYVGVGSFFRDAPLPSLQAPHLPFVG